MTLIRKPVIHTLYKAFQQWPKWWQGEPESPAVPQYQQQLKAELNHEEDGKYPHEQVSNQTLHLHPFPNHKIQDQKKLAI